MIHDRNEQWQDDQARDAYLTQQGIRVVRLSNDRIVAETETVLEEIANCLSAGARVSKKGDLVSISPWR